MLVAQLREEHFVVVEADGLARDGLVGAREVGAQAGQFGGVRVFVFHDADTLGGEGRVLVDPLVDRGLGDLERVANLADRLASGLVGEDRVTFKDLGKVALPALGFGFGHELSRLRIACALFRPGHEC